jgi:Photosystem II 4 kDa reaction centre component
MILPETFSVGITCQLIDLLPAFPIAVLGAAFAWQAIIGFR